MKNTYEHVELQFALDGETVGGILDGDYHYWTFSSASPPFLKYIAAGVLESSAGWTIPIPKEVHMLYKSIWTAAENKGYSFDEK